MTLRVTCQKLTATRSGPMYSNLWSGKSAPVITALTPGSFGLVGIDRADARMGVRRAQHLAVERARIRHVGAIHRAPRDLRHAIRTDRPSSYPFIARGRDIVHGGISSVRQNLWRRV